MNSDPDPKSKLLVYTGSNFFRQRVVLATLFQKPICIRRIRDEDIDPGLRRYEAALLRLIDKITDGSSFSIDVTGTEVSFSPGCLIGGDDLVHDCGTERTITYFLEALLFLSPFAKNPLSITLKGNTHGSCVRDTHHVMDPSVDLFRSVLPGFMKRISPEFDALKIDVVKRGFPPLGKGEVKFVCPVLRKISPFQMIQQGRVKRIRGVAVTNHVSPQFAVRMIDRVRWGLNDLLPDVWVYHVPSRQGNSGPSPGYGITLVSETIKGYMKGIDVVHDKNLEEILDASAEKLRAISKQPSVVSGEKSLVSSDEDLTDANTTVTTELSTFSTQELIGLLAVKRLLLEIHEGGVISTTFQYIPLLFMALAEEHEVCEIKTSQLTPYTIQFLRHIKDFANVTFGIDECPTENDDMSTTDNDAASECSEKSSNHNTLPHPPQLILKCVGIGYRNLTKTTS